MTTCEAKVIVRSALERQGLFGFRLSARTISFSDLARGSAVFVKVHAWKPSRKWQDVKDALPKGILLEV